MATKTRGERTKGDFKQEGIETVGILDRIPTRGLVRNCRQPIYYEILHSLDFNNLSALQQTLAILYGQKFCELLDILDTSKVRNSEDIRMKVAALLDSTQAYNQLLSLNRALMQSLPKPPSKDTTSTGEIPLDGMDLQAMLSNLEPDTETTD